MSREASSFERSKSRQQTDPAQPGWEGASRILLRLVDAGLLGVIFVAPLFMGGRGDIGRLVYVALVCGTAACWLGRQCLLADARWRWSGLEWVLLAGVLLVVLQLAPLPPGVLRTLSPQVPGLLPLWTTQATPETQLGVWNELTLSPQATRGGLITFLAHAMLFLVLVQRIRDVHDVQASGALAGLGCHRNGRLGTGPVAVRKRQVPVDLRTSLPRHGRCRQGFVSESESLRPLPGSGHRPAVVVAAAIVDRGAEEFLRVRRPVLEPRRNPQACFDNRSGPGCLCRSADLLAWRRAGDACGHRDRLGAIDPAGPARQKVTGSHRRIGRRDGGGLDDFRIRAACYHGSAPCGIPGRWTSFAAAASALWAAHLKAIPQFAWTGVGVGSHPYIYPTYLEEDFDVEFTHGENGYLHLLVETGIPGLVLMLAAAATIFFWCLRVAQSPSGTEGPALAAALVPGLAASLLHSFGDFVWYIPACLSLTIVLAACACRMCQLTPGRQPDPCSADHCMAWHNRLRR